MQSALLLLTGLAVLFLGLTGWELSKKSPKNITVTFSRYGIIAFLAAICALGLFIRVYFPWHNVFQNGTVLFLETDAYYHMWVVDNILAGDVGFIEALKNSQLMDLIIVAIINLLGWGQPSPLLVDVVGAFFPPIVGVATLVVVYFLVKALFGQYIALASTFLVNIIPSEFMHRSLLGFTDHHVLEVFLMVLTLFLLVKALQEGVGVVSNIGQTTLPPKFSTTERRSFGNYHFWALLAGFSLFLYFANWQGGLFFAAILLVYWFLQTNIDVWFRRQFLWMNQGRADHFQEIMAITLGTAGMLYLPFSTYPLATASCFIPGTYYLLNKASRYLKALTPQRVLVTGYCVGASLVFVALSGNDVLLASAKSFVLTGGMVVSEARPLLFIREGFSLVTAWTHLQWLMVFVPAGLMFVTIIAIKHRRLDWLLFAVWCLVLVIATMGQTRYLYYLTVCVGILTASTAYAYGAFFKPKYAAVFLAMVVALGGWGFTTTIISVASESVNIPTEDWQKTADWLKIAPGGHYTTWPDYTYYIQRETGRDAVILPGNARVIMAKLYLASDTESIADNLAVNQTRYLVLDYGSLTNKWWAAPELVGLDRSRYFEKFYYYADESKQILMPLLLYYPPYYQTMAARLYWYGGQAYDPEEIPVYYYVEKEINGERLKILVAVASYNSQREAEEAITKSKIPGAIASEYPDYSPVALERLDGFFKVFEARTIKVFDYESAASLALK